MKLINGKWRTGNLYDALVAAKVDKFINLHRELPTQRRQYNSFPLYVYNHQFNFKNRTNE